MDRNILNIKHFTRNFFYIFFGFKASFLYRIGFIYSTIQKPFFLLLKGAIKNAFPFKWEFQIENFFWKFLILEPSDMHWILSPYSETYLTDEFLEVKNGVFLDIWANIWKYSILMWNRWLDVVSIEPNPLVCKYLLDNIHLNSLESKIRVFPKWIGKAGKFQLSIPKWNNFWCWTLFSESYPKDFIENTIDCEIVEYVEFSNVFELRQEDIRLIKIDTEWAEVDIIRSMSSALSEMKQCKIIIEIWNEYNLQSIILILNKAGFNLVRNYQLNYIFCKN